MLRLTHDYLGKITKDVKYVVLSSRGTLYFTGKNFITDPMPGLTGDGCVITTINNTDQEPTQHKSEEYFVKGYVELIKFLISKDKKVIFAIDVPEFGYHSKKCITRNISLSKKKTHSCVMDRNVVDKRQKRY
ncbi:MAG: hypothetical protein HRU35_07730 [Rickettsiaceae bacterium]|nr:hypothetical protein [Rickettsiaceae bacterium]